MHAEMRPTAGLAAMGFGRRESIDMEAKDLMAKLQKEVEQAAEAGSNEGEGGAAAWT